MKNQRNQESSSSSWGSKLKNANKKHILLYTVIGAAAIYGLQKVPYLRNVAMPFIANAATKYFGGLHFGHA